MLGIYKDKTSNVIAEKGMAATSNPLSTQEAISILKKGGNAVDAAIAASVVQAVVEPGSTGIGGDCFAIVSLNNKNPICINGSGIAPKKANYEFYNKNNIKKINLTSPHSVTIPGSVDAWYSMHKKFGKLDFKELFINAEKYAREGFPVYRMEALTWKKNQKKLSLYQPTKNIFLPNNSAPKFKEIFKNLPLANSLKIISEKGSKGFYEGYLVKDMVNTLKNIGGLHSEEDFANQKTIFSNTINNNYKDYKLHQCPLNNPGIIVLMMMATLDKFQFKNINPHSFERYHIEAEVTKVCYEIKETALGDPKYENIIIENLLSDNFINKLFNKISFKKTFESKRSIVTSHPETIYLTVVDKDLNAVSFINSICHAFGSGITSEKTGVLFQNRGVNFRLEKNHPNVISGSKRPLHTIIPGLLTDYQNRPIFSYGVMGGQYQPIGQAHLLQNIFDFGMSVQKAIDSPRAFSLNNNLILEKKIPNKIFNKLKNIGHNAQYTDEYIGGAQGIFIDRNKGILIGGSDKRKDGFAFGY